MAPTAVSHLSGNFLPSDSPSLSCFSSLTFFAGLPCNASSYNESGIGTLPWDSRNLMEKIPDSTQLVSSFPEITVRISQTPLQFNGYCKDILATRYNVMSSLNIPEVQHKPCVTTVFNSNKGVYCINVG